MARRWSSFGLFGIFGRSEDLKALDRALRSVDIHPNLMPEGVKLAAVRLIADHAVGDEPAPQAYRASAEILGYCMIGPAGFASVNGEDLALRTERRIDLALEAGESLDAKLILLLLHAKLIQPAVIDQFQLESSGG